MKSARCQTKRFVDNPQPSAVESSRMKATHVNARIQTGDADDSLTASTNEQRARHTPGPWRVIDAPEDHYGVQMGRIGGFMLPLENAKSNAQVIAVAPEMLAMLKESARLITALGRGLNALNEHRFDAAVIRGTDAIDVVVAKAAGR